MMKFDIAKENTKWHSSLQEILKTNKREILLFFMPQIEKIKQDLYDKYSVENIYIHGDILQTDKYNTDTISILIEMEKECFEKMIDSHYIDQYKDINFGVSLNNIMYYKKNKWEESVIVPKFKLLI